ncbi:hypothetical protein BU14_0109s0010 [Porphyra umbilicalis]|uniref:Uncharacterized protein n=1 Tax=Porphyra umbilicalis TaxID=2786 RepID=A0A1X6PCD5_PORUM|nr:hypothetical protein BU14_0109s0010 [Porphyra umbilicalis]|eukprot:OSX78410.1 hypothetical protein BU14_0109s0010 [Porphyra umbilicalis]
MMQWGGGTDAGGAPNATPPAAGVGSTAHMSAGSRATPATGWANVLVDDDGIAPVRRADATTGEKDHDDAAWESAFDSWTQDNRRVPRPFGFASSPPPSSVAPSQPGAGAGQEAVAVATAIEIDEKMPHCQAALMAWQTAAAVEQAASGKSALALEAFQAAVKDTENKRMAATEALAERSAANAATTEAAAVLVAAAAAAEGGGGSVAPPPKPRRRTRKEKDAKAAVDFWAKEVCAGKVSSLTPAERKRVFHHVAAAGAKEVYDKLREEASPADRAGRSPAIVRTNGDVEKANETEMNASTADGGCNGRAGGAHAALQKRSKHFNTKVSRWRKKAMVTALAADLAEIRASRRGGGAHGAGPDRSVENSSGGGGEAGGGQPARSGAGQGRCAPLGANARAAAQPPGPAGARTAAPADAGCPPANGGRLASGRRSPPVEGGGDVASGGATAATGRRPRNGVGRFSARHS